MKKIYLLLLFFLPFLFSCAYFNTFYNAKYYFNKGYRATRNNRSQKLTSAEKNSYQKAIDKSEKLITLYPKSKYVDDALLILGQSHFYLKQYYKARERLLKLKEHFPDSRLTFDANLWLGRIAIAEEKYSEAETALNNLKYSTIPKRLRSDVHSSLGELYIHTKRFKQAIDEYENALKSGEKESKSDYYFTIAACFDSIGEYEKAKKYCEKSLKSAQTRDIRFQARFNIGLLEKKLGNYDNAIKIFERLLLDDSNKKFAGRLNLEIADCLALKKDIDGAIIVLEDITQEFKKKKEAAEAYYRLGEILEKQKRDYDKAAFNYGQVKIQFRASPYADSAEVKKRDILRMQALRQVIKMAVTGEKGEGVSIERDTNSIESDSLSVNAELDSLNTPDLQNRQNDNSTNNNIKDSNNARDTGRGMQPPVLEDERGLLPDDESIARRQVKKKQNRPAENPELSSFKKEEIDKNIYLLGELYFTRFSLIDSAVNRFGMLVKKFPNSIYTPKALYVLSHIYSDIYHDSAGADIYYRTLIDNYPATDFANYARKKLGLKVIPTKLDSARNLFQEGENALFDRNNAKEAFRIYEEVHERFPETEFAAKSFYIQGWICETVWDSLKRAVSIYDTLIARYPDTPYAADVKPKIVAVNEARKKAEAELERAKKEAEAKTDKVEHIKVKPDSLNKKTIADKDSTAAGQKEKILTKIKKEKDIPVKKGKTFLKRDEPVKNTDKKIRQKDSSDISKSKKVSPKVDSTKTVDVRTIKTDAYIVGGVDALSKNISIPEILKGSVPPVVVVQIFIDAKGEPKKTDLVGKEENSTLLAVISAAVRRTEFKPAITGGKPVSSWLTVRIPLKELSVE